MDGCSTHIYFNPYKTCDCAFIQMFSTVISIMLFIAGITLGTHNNTHTQILKHTLHVRVLGAKNRAELKSTEQNCQL